jgi:hypothetical protein
VSLGTLAGHVLKVRRRLDRASLATFG